MRLHLWGTDFRRGSTTLRRALFVPEEQREALLKELLRLGFCDAIYLATCNRVEFYTTASDHYVDLRPLWTQALQNLGLEEQAYYLGYHFEGKAALRHLLRVGCSLESMVVGEPQILGQLKLAYRRSLDWGIPLDPQMQQIFQFVFETARKVRSETRLGEGAVSVASLAWSRLRKEHMPRNGVVVVGRGKLSEFLIQKTQAEFPDVPLWWVNRSVDRLPRSSRHHNLSLAQFQQQPPHFDVLFTATASAEPILQAPFFEKLPAASRWVCDLGQPPDIEEAVSGVLRMGDLHEAIRANREERKERMLQAEVLVESSLRAFLQKQKELPVLSAFGNIEQVFQVEMEKAMQEIPCPAELHPRLEQWGRLWIKRNAHLSREQLRLALHKAALMEAP